MNIALQQTINATQRPRWSSRVTRGSWQSDLARPSVMRQPTSTAPPPPRRRRAAARSARATRRAPRRRAPGPRAITPAADAHRRGPARSGVGTVGETRVPGDGRAQYVERIYGREVLASGEGGIGYLLKDRVGDVGEWVDALGRVAPGGTVLDPQVVSAVMARQEPVERLTARERDVLGLMGPRGARTPPSPPRSSSPRRRSAGT
jgi:hypothetical protein